MTQFDFEYWMGLAGKDPEAFEREKKSALMNLVTQAPESMQNHLTGLVDSLCIPQEGSGLDKARHAQSIMVQSLQDLQRANLTLMQSLAEMTAPLVDNVTHRYTRLVLEK